MASRIPMQAKSEKRLMPHTRRAADLLTTLSEHSFRFRPAFPASCRCTAHHFCHPAAKDLVPVEGLCCAFCASPRCTTPFSRVRVHLLAALLGYHIEDAVAGRIYARWRKSPNVLSFVPCLQSAGVSSMWNSPHEFCAPALRLKLGKEQ